MGECMILRRNGAYTGTMAGQPLGFKAVSSRIGSIDLSWTTVPEDTAYAALRILRRDDRFPKDEQDGEVIYEGPGSSCTDEGLTPGATYYYRAFARSKDGVYQNSYCQVTGTVLVTNTKDETLMISLEDGTPLTVDVSDASFVSTSGSSYSLSKLKAEDRVQIYGQYSGNRFAATLVVKQ